MPTVVHRTVSVAGVESLLASDYPGFGYSASPEPTCFSYTLDGYARFLERFAEQLKLSRYALYPHDYGSQIGLRLAMKAPQRVAEIVRLVRGFLEGVRA